MITRNPRARRPIGTKARVWLTLSAVAVAGAGVVAVAVADTPDDPRPPAAAEPTARAHEPEVHSIGVTERGRGVRGVDRRATEAFSALALSWPSTAGRIDGRAEVRTRDVATGAWRDWRELEPGIQAPETEEGDERTARGGTELRWVGPSDGVEVRVVAGDGGVEGLPAGMRLDLIDPGMTPEEAAAARGVAAQTREFAPAAATDGAAEPGDAGGGVRPAAYQAQATDAPEAPPSTVARPPIVSRAAWGADESLVAEPSAYIERIDTAFVHHTAGTNAYSCADAPAIIRAIMVNDIRNRGNNDIGYNFLVDKCGTVYEGRHGGVDLPVMGAHTFGFNSYSTGIAVLGDFSTDGVPTRRITDAVARVAAWKLGQYGVDPTGRVTLTALEDTGVWQKGEQATLRTIAGHRDGVATQCPGASLYAELDEIRRFAAGPGASAAAPTADVNGDGLVDLMTGTPKDTVGGHADAGTVHVVPGGREGPVAAGRTTISQNTTGVPGLAQPGDSFGAATAYGDVDGDGYADAVVGSPGENLDGVSDAGSVTVVYGPDFTSGSQLSADPADRVAGARLGSAVAVGDFDSDGSAEVFTVSQRGPAGWWVLDPAGGTVSHGRLATGTGDVATANAATTGDFDQDGYADVVASARNAGGAVRLAVFDGSASGLTADGLLVTRGGRSLAAGDTDADGYDDLVIGQPFPGESQAHNGGQVTVLRGSGGGFTAIGKRVIHQNTTGVPGAAESGDAMGSAVSAGDYDLDGDADVLVGLPLEDLRRGGTLHRNAGMTLLLDGSPSGVTGAGAHRISQDTAGVPGYAEVKDRLGWSVQLADLSGWGRADLAIGVPGENTDNGQLLQIDSGSAGLGLAGGVYYRPGDFGVPPDTELGSSLAP